MNDAPHGWPTATIEAWRGWPPNLLQPRVEDWPHGTRRAATDAEEILSTAVGWWDASRYRDGDRFLRNQGIAGDVIDARLGSSTNANSNDPLFLPVGERGYMYVPGVTGNGVTAPDSVALSVANDIDIKIESSLNSWASGTTQPLVAKWNSAASARSYLFYVSAIGELVLLIHDGTNNFTFTSSAATGIPANDLRWVRATFDADNGSGGANTKFYTSADGTTWTQLGNTRSVGSTIIIADTTAGLEIGRNNSGLGTTITGSVYRVIIQSAYDTTDNTTSVVFDADFTNLTASQTTFTESSANAATVTINRSTTGRKAVIMPARWNGGRSCFLFGTDDYFEIPNLTSQDPSSSLEDAYHNNSSPASRLLIFQDTRAMSAGDWTLMFVARLWGTNANSIMDRNNTGVGTLTSASIGTTFGVLNQVPRLTMRGTTSASTTDGPASSAGSMLCAIATITFSNAGVSRRTVYTNGVAGTTNTVAIGAWPDTTRIYRFRMGASDNISNTPADMEFFAAAAFRRVLTPAEINTICRYYGAI